VKLIVGLGNPGFRYRRSRHNVGFMAVEALARKNGIRIKKKLFNALTGEGRIFGEKVLLLLPQTYMNLSGESVKAAIGTVGGSSDLLLIYDDIDLPLGNIRFRAKGSSGGHKGIHSVIDKLKTEDMQRLRIGIRPDKKVYDTTDFVLRSFSKTEKEILNNIIREAVEGIEVWLSSGIDECMERFNRKITD